MEAIRRVYCPIAWLLPGHYPGAGGCVATTALQRAFFCLGTFWIKDATSGRCRDHVGIDATEGCAAESGSSGRGDSCST